MARLHQEIKNRTIGYILGAFGLVAGLAWNNAINSLIEYLVPIGTNTLLLKFIYAVVITVVVVIIGYYFSKLTDDEEKKKVK